MNTNDSNRGLYVKYEVKKVDTGETVEGCFVLRPDRDPHARAALEAYANSCEDHNPSLSADIRRWLIDLMLKDPDYPEG